MVGHQAVNVTFPQRGSAEGLSQAVRRALFRVVQEALKNAIKHSGAEHVGVVVTGLPQATEVVLLLYDSVIKEP